MDQNGRFQSGHIRQQGIAPCLCFSLTLLISGHRRVAVIQGGIEHMRPEQVLNELVHVPPANGSVQPCLLNISVQAAFRSALWSLFFRSLPRSTAGIRSLLSSIRSIRMSRTEEANQSNRAVMS